MENKKIKINQKRLRKLWETINICIKDSQKRIRKKWKEKLFKEIIAKNFLNLKKNIYLDFKEAQQT